MENYHNLMVKLYNLNLHSGVKLGLLNCQKLSQILNAPEKSFASIHVAGTNGKGSVVTKISKGLEFSGKRVGLYTSPHISCFRERIKINGEMIAEEDISRILQRIFKLCHEANIPATFFEVTTFLAFLYFAEQKVDVAVIETGLGGRLDATNLVRPILTVITSISLDHVDILGNTLEKIASEKAGIVKYKIPLVIGPHAKQNIILKTARVQQSPLIEVEGNYETFDDENNAIAKKALEFLSVTTSAIDFAIRMKPDCRCEILQEGKIVLDVAHNPQGLGGLFSSLQKMFPNKKFRIIFGLSKTKDVDHCLDILKENGQHFHLVAARNGRGIPCSELKEKMVKKGFREATLTIDPTIQTSINRAQRQVRYNEIVIVCGTFFIMSEARKALGIKEPCDQFDINEIFSPSPL